VLVRSAQLVQTARLMFRSLLYRLLCIVVGWLARGDDDRCVEIAVLRHQLKILSRGGRRPRYTTADRALLAAASRVLPPERWSCFLVGPETLRRWHRTLLRGRRKRPGAPGRPPLPAETRELILRLARENPRWGYMRIRGELLKLGIDVSATTIATLLRRRGLGPAPRRIGPTWTQFLRAQAHGILGGGLPREGDDPRVEDALPEDPPPSAEAPGPRGIDLLEPGGVRPRSAVSSPVGRRREGLTGSGAQAHRNGTARPPPSPGSCSRDGPPAPRSRPRHSRRDRTRLGLLAPIARAGPSPSSVLWLLGTSSSAAAGLKLDDDFDEAA